MVMAIPIALGFSLGGPFGACAAPGAAGGWGAGSPWAGPESSALVWRAAVAMALVVASCPRSRGGIRGLRPLLPSSCPSRRGTAARPSLPGRRGRRPSASPGSASTPLRHHFAAVASRGAGSTSGWTCCRSQALPAAGRRASTPSPPPTRLPDDLAAGWIGEAPQRVPPGPARHRYRRGRALFGSLLVLLFPHGPSPLASRSAFRSRRLRKPVRPGLPQHRRVQLADPRQRGHVRRPCRPWRRAGRSRPTVAGVGLTPPHGPLESLQVSPSCKSRAVIGGRRAREAMAETKKPSLTVLGGPMAGNAFRVRRFDASEDITRRLRRRLLVPPRASRGQPQSCPDRGRRRSAVHTTTSTDAPTSAAST